MRKAIFSLYLVVASSAFCNQIDQVCLRRYCQSLDVENGEVRFVDRALSRSIVLGTYLAADQRLVPKTEAPIRHLDSPRGWRIIISAFLDHEEGEARLRLRFFGPDGALRETEDILSILEDAEAGRLFGGEDEIFEETSTEEHSYNAQTEIWYLPERGDPKLVLLSQSTVRKYSDGTDGSDAGVIVDRETYDGVHGDTKGRVAEFWAWNPTAKALVRRAP